MYELLIENNNTIYKPLVQDGVTWTTKRIGAPGKLEFKVLKDRIINFQEGNSVRFIVDGKNVFFGYVWSKQRSKDQLISVVAYDQLRYLKYKDTYLYENKKASDVVKMIAQNQLLKTGVIEDTGYVIQERLRDNETFFDIIYDALGLTFDNTKKMYVLYDDFGRINLKNIESMLLNIVVGENTAEDFDYKTSLDNVYNFIKLAHDNEKTGKRDIYTAPSDDTINDNIKRWGLLQYFEKIDEKTNGQFKANTLLEIYNRKARSLTIKKALGDIRVRGGSSVIVFIPAIGDTSIQNYMLVDRAVHRFSDNEHTMDLEVRGRI